MLKRIFRIFNIKYQRTKYVYKKIVKAKQLFMKGNVSYMCTCFKHVTYYRYDDITKLIPEFKPETFGLEPKSYKVPWWPGEDRCSRIAAFDKLIDIYKTKLEKFN